MSTTSIVSSDNQRAHREHHAQRGQAGGPGSDALDGGMALWMACARGATVTAVTLVSEQIGQPRRRAHLQGVHGLARFTEADILTAVKPPACDLARERLH